ncbi:MAG: hypothetical protein ABIZ80_24405, partial [Bryobacteraceae bacterium]
TFLLALLVGAFQEQTIRSNMHTAQFYLLVSIGAPLALALVAAVSPHRWACTIVACIYTVYYCLFIWILPLFPAEPKLAPVYIHLTRFVPPDFPLLLILPAIAFDLARRAVHRRSKWTQSLLAGGAFLLAFIAVQWPFAWFLQSPASRTWVFGTQHVPYFVPPTSDYARYAFTTLEHTAAEFWIKMTAALAIAILMTRLGFAWGEGIERIRR